MEPQSVYEPLLRTSIIILVAQIASYAAKKVIRTLTNRLKDSKITHKTANPGRVMTVASLLKNLANVSIWGIAVATILPIWNINIGPLLAGAGVIGLAIGFGAQALVRDIISGLFMLVEDYINVGDQVEIAGKKGEVVSIKLRTTIIKDEEAKTTHIIPNSAISIISKFNKS